MNTNPIESSNLLFYNFNAGSQPFNLNGGKNARLATRDDFRRTGMAGAKIIDKNKIEPSESEIDRFKRRPITSHFK